MSAYTMKSYIPKMKKLDATPREAAYSVAIDWLSHAYHGLTNDVPEMTDSEPEQRAVRKQIAKLHNRLLRDSGMDGLEINEEN